LKPVDFNHVKVLTAQIGTKISAGTFDSPSWDLIRTAKIAARIYAPLGTMMTLGDFVRLTRTFLEFFKDYQEKNPDNVLEYDEIQQLQVDLRVSGLVN